MLMPEGSYVHPLLAADDPPVRRNSYLYYQLSVTPYVPAERFAGGRFAMMSDGSDTLGAWTARDRPIGNRDIVAWYTVGFHHITRMEDWPVMPTHWFGLRHQSGDDDPGCEVGAAVSLGAVRRSERTSRTGRHLDR